MNKYFKNTVTAGLTVIAALFAYDRHYRTKYQWNQLTTEEENVNNITLSSMSFMSWISEDNMKEQMNHLVIPYVNNYLYSDKLYNGSHIIEYKLYLKDKGRPTIVIVHGLNEFKEKYLELTYYFLQNNFNVLSYDQRDHGKSRSDASKDLINTLDFNDYIQDLKKLIEHVSHRFGLLDNFFAFGHSMGGAVVMGCLQEYPELFKCAVLSSPMLTINTQPYSQSITYLLSVSAKVLSLADRPIPSSASQKVFPKSDLIQNNPSYQALTNSKARGQFSFELNQQINHVVTKDATMNWLNTSMKHLNRISDQSKLSDIQQAVLLVRSVNDQIVDPMGIYKAADLIPNARLIAVEEAGHEIYQEKDYILKPYVNSVIQFYNQNV